SGRPVRVSPELFEALSLFDQWRTRTSGALDPAAQVVSKIWSRAAAERRTPSVDELQVAVATIARPHYQLDAATRTATRLGDAPRGRVAALNPRGKTPQRKPRPRGGGGSREARRPSRQHRRRSSGARLAGRSRERRRPEGRRRKRRAARAFIDPQPRRRHQRQLPARR